MHTSLIQIFIVNGVREGVGKKTGNPYRMQDCECALLDEAGKVTQVGVLMLGKSLMEKVQPGTYAAAFSLSVNFERKVVAVVTELTPVKIEGGRVTVVAPAASKS